MTRTGARVYSSGAGARLYDRVMAPLEARSVGRWRRKVWEAVPGEGLGLEVGAGTGANSALHPPGASVVTIDLSLAMLRRAREKEAPAVVGRVVADAEALPFRGGTFDWAAETLVFCEVADPVAGYAEVARTVRAGGPLIFLEHVRPSGILGRLADLLTPLTRRLWGEHLNRRAADLVRAAGLTIVREEWLWRDLVTLIVARAGDGEAAARPTHL